ncbi:hypothetical protein K470DRAFT_254491 [Piedraia hortae CBS 480.64]|uniref:Uncharacterized protein n=1 Tax=Piedraia hortae CBS 480.64 TaxID=1314780 RepID=A0A6A7C9U3_9PEZI|nr:hypothetical protein K470DRAFT_254491 [Piedraia hortae CBS 480.64]
MNPALPSGVHQKALEVYSYIFSTFGAHHLSLHLTDYLPGLASVLSFASLSVRPALYALFEHHIVRLPAKTLRPALKSLILGLSPAIEEESGEDFDRAFAILQKLEDEFAQPDPAEPRNGYFWQCLFLCVITSPSRRPGMLNYMSRRLPNFTTDSLSDEAYVVICPEPGLLVRAFVAGLSDDQVLAQREFLNLLVTHLPLNSPVLREKIDQEDLDRLVAATVQVLLRRDMSLNRRLWSWFVGPSKEESGSQEDAPQREYFRKYGEGSLRRVMLSLLDEHPNNAAQVARPLRICLSLMDRWEIGGSILTEVFPPALESVYTFGQTASASEVKEVMRSASLFFDGVEAGLVWTNFCNYVRKAFEERSGKNLRLVNWALGTFNVSDEEMVLIHAPLTLSLIFDLLNRQSTPTGILTTLALEIADKLSQLIPERALKGDGSEEVEEDNSSIIARFYRELPQSAGKVSLPMGRSTLAATLLHQVTSLVRRTIKDKQSSTFCELVPVMDNLLSITRDVGPIPTLPMEIQGWITECPVSFSVLNAILSLTTEYNSAGRITANELFQLQPLLTAQLWAHLSPSRPKYHVEAVRALWQLNKLAGDDNKLQALLITQMRSGTKCQTEKSPLDDEAVRRFAILWNHSMPAQVVATKNGGATLTRRSSAATAMADAAKFERRRQILAEPLSWIVDVLGATPSVAAETARDWLAALPTLRYVFEIIFERLEIILKEDEERVEDPKTRLRVVRDKQRGLVYVLGQLEGLLRDGGDWTWNSLSNAKSESEGARYIAQVCSQMVSRQTSTELDRRCLNVLRILMTSPVSNQFREMALDSVLMDRLLGCVANDEDDLQGLILDMIPDAINLRLVEKKASNTPSLMTTQAPPPPQLLKCLRMGFTSKSGRRHMAHWLRFLSSMLPTFSNAIFASLLPLVECLCGELDAVFSELVRMTEQEDVHEWSPDAVCLGLLEALEMVLARAHDCLAQEQIAEEATQSPVPNRGLFGTMTSGVFKSEGPPSKTAQANSRLTVVLAFHDSIQTCLKIWGWSNEHDHGSSATTTYYSLRLRHKARHLLEQMFMVEPLESLEVVISLLSNKVSTALDLLHVMQGSRPKNVVPTILNALCGRIDTQSGRQMSVDMTAADIAVFLLQYVNSLEDDALDEIWTDCIAFLRDVLANPLPYRQALPPLLSLVQCLSQKSLHTNFSEQRRMRRELIDIFQRLLAASLTTVPGIPTPDHDERTKASNLISVLTDAVRELDTIVETPERIITATNNITNSIITPLIHSKSFPTNLTPEILTLLHEISRKSPTSKSWKREVHDAIHDARIFSSPLTPWLPIIHQWMFRDPDRLTEQLSRLTPPSTAGSLFGVNANATRLDSDRKTQLTLRRITLILLSSPKDTHLSHLKPLLEKIADLSSATESSFPSSTIKAEVLILSRAATLSFSPPNLSALWPLIDDLLDDALTAVLPSGGSGWTNNGILQACKLLDQLVSLAPDEFLLRQWLFIADSTDAVYRSTEGDGPLAEQIAGVLAGAEEGAEGDDVLGVEDGLKVGTRGGLRLEGLRLDGNDIRALPRGEFARVVVRPFVRSLAMGVYEDTFALRNGEEGTCREGVVRDLGDGSSIV